MSNIILASKTITAINEAMERDQGSSFRGFLKQVIPFMDDAYRTEKEEFRSHMGGSLIGGECGRAIWYGFNWATKPHFNGKTLRLFNRGHLEEARMIALLLMIGVQVYQQDANGKQFRISAVGGHFGGSGDGVGIGIPDIDASTPALLEFKTHGDKSFIKLKAEGMRDSKFEHYIQMNVYMRKMGIAVGLYLAVNKNTDELYGEIVPLDVIMADKFLVRAATIIPMRTAPTKLNESAGWFGCKFCDHKPICHLGQPPERNCRTCEHSDPSVQDGKWYCKINVTNPLPISKEVQFLGCDSYLKSSAYNK